MAMNKMSDMAALGALESLGGGGGGGMPLPEEMGAAPVEGGGGIEEALATIESSLAGAPPDLADEARTHINALREIGAQIGGGGAPPEEIPQPEELPLPAPGQEIA